MQLKAQQGYKKTDIIPDFKTEKIVNGASANGRLSGLQKDLTIIDFFGTWCTPCIRALPVLAAIQKQYADKISVVLVSVERTEQLQKFISGQIGFSFPVIADADKIITDLFQPPAYPYTVVINKNNEVVAITEVAMISYKMIDQWLHKDKNVSQKIAEQNVSLKIKNTPVIIENLSSMNTLLNLSQNFIYASKTGNETAPLEKKLSEFPFD